MATATAHKAPDNCNWESNDAIIRKHEDLIRSVALSFVSRGVELDDLMQVGRIALFNAIRSWRAEAALWTYAKRSVQRDLMRYVTNELEEPGRPTAAGEVFESEGERTLETAERIALTREMLVLTPEERHVLRMRFVDDLDVRAIAAQLELPRSTAHDLLQGAIAKLRERVGAQL